jgi:hypothetical protein
VPRGRFLPVEHAHRGPVGPTLTDFELARADFGEFSVSHDLVPLDAFLPLALLIGVEAAPQFLEMRLAMLAERGRPLRDRSSPRDLKFYRRVSIAEIDRPLMRAEVPHVHASVVEEAEISLMERHRVVPVDAVLG